MSDSYLTTISHETHLIVTPNRKEIARFMGRVAPSCSNTYNGEYCWEWQGRPNNKGYGRFVYKSKVEMAHRWIVAWLVAPLPRGIKKDSPQIDHLCRNRICCNPVHLDIVLPVTNVHRGMSPIARNAYKMYCPVGHPYYGDNLIVEKAGGRRCKICHNGRTLRAYYRKRDAARVRI